MGHHREWVRSAGLDPRKPQIHEHFALMLVLEMLGCVDQLGLGNLLGVEILLRRAQLIESAFELAKNGNPDFFHADDMMGLSTRSSGACLAPALERATAERLKHRAEIAREIRNARGGGKDSGKGREKEKDKPPKGGPGA